MSLDRIMLIIVCICAGIWAVVMMTGLIATLPFGLPILIVFGTVAYVLYRVVRERLANAEDDYYEKNVDR